MADDQDTSKEVGDDGGVADYDGNDANDVNDIVDTNDITATTTVSAPIIDNAANSAVEDYDDGPLPDVTIELIINDLPGGGVTDIVNAAITDQYGNLVTTTPWRDSVDGYTSAITQGIYDELAGNGTDIGGKRWWGSWSWNKALFVGLIALTIIGIILALIFLITGKKFKKNKPATTPGASTTKAVVTKSVTSPEPKYSQVPTDV